ncbi:MAG: hypothetical protein CME06_18325 [Gemmatimonadetes bacterium]|nr:hypothetical protein [Gemmatimonadota bacterium]
MSLDRQVLAERAIAVERHLERVRLHLPEAPERLAAGMLESDAVILHMWQATQIVIDLAMAACVRLGAGTPSSYGEAFRGLGDAGHLRPELADRLAKAAGFRKLIVHNYEDLDLARVEYAARKGPADLRAFLAAIRDASRREDRG